MTGPRIILYSQPGCPPCFAAKSYLKAKGVAFTYKDVQADPQAMRELMELNSRSTPTLVVGSKLMIGFDPDELDRLLAEARLEPSGSLPAPEAPKQVATAGRD